MAFCGTIRRPRGAGAHARCPMTDRSSTSGALFATRLRLACAAVLWERVWPFCWPMLAALGAFLILGLFDVLPHLPGALHAAVLLGFAAAIVIPLVSIFRRIAVPDFLTGRRRIERASGLEHRPLQALADRPNGPLDPQAARLWEVHLRRMEAMTRRLRIGMPRAGIDAGSDWRDRLARALTPDLGDRSAAAAASLDIWVTPPEYTGLAPQFLRPGTTETIRIPTGSKLLAQVHGGRSVPRL